MNYLLSAYIPLSFLSVFLYGEELCDDGWFLAGHECYHVIPTPKTFDEAKALCETDKLNSTMAELETMGEKKSLVTHMRTTFEIVYLGDLFWVGAYGDNKTFYWNSGSPVDYDDYYDDKDYSAGCLAFGTTTAEKYEVSNCTETHLVICESSPTDKKVDPSIVG